MFGINNNGTQHHLFGGLFGSSQVGTTTVINSSTKTTVATVANPTLNVGSALRNAAIGAGAGGVLGVASLLGKFSIPLLGKVASVAGIAKFAGIGGGVGLATALWPVVSPTLNKSPKLKAAVMGAGIGAAASIVVPFVGPVFGAIAGAAIGFGVKAWSSADVPSWNTSGSAYGDGSQGGWVAVGPASQYGYGNQAGGIVPQFMNGGYPSAGAGYGQLQPYGASMGGYGSPYGVTSNPYAAAANPYAGVASPYGGVALPLAANPASAASIAASTAQKLKTKSDAAAAAAKPSVMKAHHLSAAMQANRVAKAKAAKVAADKAAATAAQLAGAAVGATQTLPLSIANPAAYLGSTQIPGGSPFGAAGDPFAAGQQFQNQIPQYMNTPGIGLPGNYNTGLAPSGPAPTLTGL